MNRHSSLLMALAAGETLPGPELILVILLLGFISYGLSIFSACMHSTGWGLTIHFCYDADNTFFAVCIYIE